MSKNSYGLAIAVGSATLLFFIANPATADPYKWCAIYRVGGSNCGFVTLEQCRATVSGIGGDCQPNQFYTGPDKTPATHTTPAKRTQKQPQRKPAPEHRVPEDRFQSLRPFQSGVQTAV
jgi:hypothetical protein